MQVRSKELVWLVLLALVLGAQAMRAQGEPETPSKEQADKFFQAQEWGKAATAYEDITKREPSNGRAWFRLGVARHNLKQYARAIAAWEQAEKNGLLRRVRATTSPAPTRCWARRTKRLSGWTKRCRQASLRFKP